MKLDFYEVDHDYIAYLKNAEIAVRGKTCVPDIDYPGKHEKLICGIVWVEPTTKLNYFVPLSSYNKQRSENFVIRVPNDQQPEKGSLRFNYMIPVPIEVTQRKIIANESDNGYRQLLMKELAVVQKSQALIEQTATAVYKKLTSEKCSQRLREFSCDFKLLETKCMEYCGLHGIPLPTQCKQTIAERLATAQKELAQRDAEEDSPARPGKGRGDEPR